MLKIIKDVTIRHDGKEIHCKAGQIVNVKASFDVNDERTRGIEVRNADKFRKFVKRFVPKDPNDPKIVIINPAPTHNPVEQSKRKQELKELEEETEGEGDENAGGDGGEDQSNDGQNDTNDNKDETNDGQNETDSKDNETGNESSQEGDQGQGDNTEDKK